MIVNKILIKYLIFCIIAVTLVCVPMAVGQSVYKLWIYGEFMCKVTGYLQGNSVKILQMIDQK